MDPKKLLEDFYSAFKAGDAEKMASLYHDDIVFEDPAFGELKGESARNMWRMLLSRADGELNISFHVIRADATGGEVKWEAKYKFGATGRNVHNKIHARIKFQGDKIIDHRDKFNFWKWSRMALGTTGFFLGWTGFFRKKLRAVLHKALDKFAAGSQENASASPENASGSPESSGE